MFNRLTAELTNLCTLSCPPCPRQHIKMPLGYMDTDLWERLLKQIPDGTTLFPFWRGEALLHPECSKMLAMAVDRFEVVLATNGVFLCSETMPPDVFYKLKAINISLHGIESVQGAAWALKQRGDNPAPIIQFNQTEGEDSRLIAMAQKLAGGHDVQLRTYKQHTLDGKWGDTGATKGQQAWCQRLGTDLVITWDGQVSRCCYVWEPIPGLDANTMSLGEIWHSQEMEVIRKGYPDEVCSTCDQWRGEGKTI